MPASSKVGGGEKLQEVERLKEEKVGRLNSARGSQREGNWVGIIIEAESGTLG